jgi:hypothetical protein
MVKFEKMVNFRNGPQKRCGDCEHYVQIKDKHGSEGLCVRFPPTAWPFPVKGVVGAAPQMMLRMFVPTVGQDERCGEYSAAAEVK